MKNETGKKVNPKTGKEDTNLPGYPEYPASDDIYNKDREEKEINPEDITNSKTPNETDLDGVNNEKNPTNDFSGGDLDIPGSELDDAQENIGSEDEENNAYSSADDDTSN